MTAAIIKRTFDIVYGAKEIRRTASVRTVNSFLIALGITAAMVLLGAMMNHNSPQPQIPGIVPGGGIEVERWADEQEDIGQPETPVEPEIKVLYPPPPLADDYLEEVGIPEPVEDELFDEIEEIEDEVFGKQEFNDKPLDHSANSSQSLSNGSGPQMEGGNSSGGVEGIPDGPSGPGTVLETVKELINKPNQVGIYDDPPVIDLDELQRRVKFPHFASLRELEGNVIVRALIDIDGSVRRVVVLQADHEVFVKSAVDAVYDVKATPAYLDGSPVACWVSIPIRFRLR